MSLAYRIAGLAFAIGVCAGLYYAWPFVWDWIKYPLVRDLRYPVIGVYIIGGLWIAEKIWAYIDRLLRKDEAA